MLRPVVADDGVCSSTDVESWPIDRLRLPVEAGAVDPGPGANTAVSRAGDPAASNAVWQVAMGFDGEMASPPQPRITTPPFSNVMVPDGAPVPLVTVATSVTPWLVTSDELEATSDVALGPAAWMRVAIPLAEPAVAVIVDEPTVVEPRIWTLYVPLRLFVTPPMN